MNLRKLSFFYKQRKSGLALLALLLLVNPFFEEAQNDGMMIHEYFVLFAKV